MRKTPLNEHLSQDRATIAKILQSPNDIATLRRLLQDILEGPAFKGSHRSAQFLRFIVEHSIEGNFDQLKERLIGIQLFQRESDYDTGEDAVVRVTASDVRRRLLQHYGWFGTSAEFRFELPLGSYVPRITRQSVEPEALGPQGSLSHLVDTGRPMVVASQVLVNHALPLPQGSPLRPFTPWLTRGIWLVPAIFLALLMLAAGAHWHRNSEGGKPHPQVQPLASLFLTGATRLITSDPNVDAVQGVSRQDLSLSDYANHHYVPYPGSLSSVQLAFCKTLLSAESAAASPDLVTTAHMAAIAQSLGKKLLVQSARGFQLANLASSDSFIFLGSPRSDPWFSLFAGELSYQFIYDHKTHSEYIRTTKRVHAEPAMYVPSATGGGTGFTFAIVAQVPNPGQPGQVLLLAGADGEGTAAAGDWVTKPGQFSTALQRCGIAPSTAAPHFEMVLRVETMAGVARGAKMIACHVLPA